MPAGTKDVQVVLTRTTEAVARPLSTLPQTVSKEERRKLAKRILEPLVQKFLDKGDDNERFRSPGNARQGRSAARDRSSREVAIQGTVTTTTDFAVRSR